MTTQLVSSICAFLLTMTSQGQQKFPPDPLTLGSRDTVHRYFLSLAIILCNKMDFSFGTNMAVFAEPVTYIIVIVFNNVTCIVSHFYISYNSQKCITSNTRMDNNNTKATLYPKITIVTT